MSFASARRAVETFFGANWQETPIAFENVAFTPPENGRWAKLMILNESSEQAAIGTPVLRRFRGRILVYCFTPHGAGAQQAADLADKAATLFDGAYLPGHTLFPPEISEQEDADGAYRVTVTIAFWRDQVV